MCETDWKPWRVTATSSLIVTLESYDYLNGLTSISLVSTASSAVSFSYQYNSANQRTRRRKADGTLWIYSYDSLVQVTSGKKYWSDWTPVARQQFEYGFDDIGNRTSTKAGGDSSGSSLRVANYSANSRNQYTSQDIPAAIDVPGLSYATNVVTINGHTAYRYGEYLRCLLLKLTHASRITQHAAMALHVTPCGTSVAPSVAPQKLTKPLQTLPCSR
jgi:hypothetical protein